MERTHVVLPLFLAELSMMWYSEGFFNEAKRVFKICCFKMTHSRSINEWDLLIYLCLYVYLMCEYVCVFTTMCNDIQSKLWNITYKAWFMSHFKLVFRWFWLIYRSFSCVMPLLPSPRQLCTHIAGNHEHTSNKGSVFQLPFNNGTCILGISHVSLLLQGVYTVHCILRSKTWHFNLLFKELSM